MNARLDEVIAEIRTLDDGELEQVFDFITELKSEGGSGEAWLNEARELQRRLTAKYGTEHFGSVTDIINEVREERLNDLMGRD